MPFANGLPSPADVAVMALGALIAAAVFRLVREVPSGLQRLWGDVLHFDEEAMSGAGGRGRGHLLE
jgi:hypothetical protein